MADAGSLTYVTHTYYTYSIVGKDLLGILELFIFRLGRDARSLT